MSHVTKIRVEIRSLAALKAACARLGLEFVEGQTTYKWYGKYLGGSQRAPGINIEDLGKCNHAIKVPGASYEVGVVQQNDQFLLMWDFWQPGGLEAQLGKDGQKLVQAYTVEAAKQAAQARGFSVWEEAVQDGSVKLHVSV